MKYFYTFVINRNKAVVKCIKMKTQTKVKPDKVIYSENDDLETSFDQGSHIVDFLIKRPFIAINKVEQAANMPKSSLHGAIGGNRKIPVKYWYDLNKVLSEYGYSISTGISSDPPESLMLPFKYLDISCLDRGVTISKNYDQINEIVSFLNNLLMALENHLPSEIEKYGNEFILKSRFLTYDFGQAEVPKLIQSEDKKISKLTVKHSIKSEKAQVNQKGNFGKFLNMYLVKEITERLNLAEFIAKYPPIRTNEALKNRIAEEFKPGGRIVFNYGIGNVIFNFSE